VVLSQWLSEADVQALGPRADDLACVRRGLNGRARKMIGYMTPLEKFVEVAAFSSWIRRGLRQN
jgi:IS30 family transposase